MQTSDQEEKLKPSEIEKQEKSQELTKDVIEDNYYKEAIEVERRQQFLSPQDERKRELKELEEGIIKNPNSPVQEDKIKRYKQLLNASNTEAETENNNPNILPPGDELT